MIDIIDDKNVTIDDRINALKEELKTRKESGLYSDESILEIENTIKSMKYLKEHPLVASESSRDSLLKKEYRSDGYFNSDDFTQKCDEFEKYIEELRKERENDFTRFEYITLKKSFMKKKYNLDWLPEEEQYLDGVKVIVD